MSITRQLIIPAGVAFSDLALNRNAKGNIQFKLNPLEKFCLANDMCLDDLLNSDEEVTSEIIVEWYIVHRQTGGKACACAEQLLNEVLQENRAGQVTSYPVGHA